MIEQIKENDTYKIDEIKKRFPQLLVDFPIFERENTFRTLYVLEINNEMIGYIILDIIYERMELVQIEVMNSKRGNGYGKQLLELMFQIAKEKKLENITLEVRIDNEVAIHLYEKYGFRKVAIRKNYYHGVDGILMERKMM